MSEYLTFNVQQLEKYASYFAFFFTKEGILVNAEKQTPLISFASTQIMLNAQIEAAYLCHAVLIVRCKITLSEEQLLSLGFSVFAIRPFLAQASTHLRQLTLKAYHWLNWDKQSCYCGQCGSPLKRKIDATDKWCDNCQSAFFPRFSPAIMVLIQRENEILLARSKHFAPGMYSAIAGFIDIGETAEVAVHREVHEEVGIYISHLKYFSSQTWPFPDSFMIAFKAHYASGDLKIDDNEIEDARWFSLDALPNLPSRPSIARRLIDSVTKK